MSGLKGVPTLQLDRIRKIVKDAAAANFEQVNKSISMEHHYIPHDDLHTNIMYASHNTYHTIAYVCITFHG